MLDKALLDQVAELALQAGRIIREEVSQVGGPRGHGSHAPVDAEIEAFLRQGLRNLRPSWSILGEELPFHRGSDPHYCWMLDPQDGTSAFLRGYRGSSVSIGLLKDHQAVLGVIYAPLYPNDSGDLIAGAEGLGLWRNYQAVPTEKPSGPLRSCDIVAVSQDADRRIPFNIGTLAPARYLALPSVAYRLALAAVGEVRVGLSLAPLRALDVVAGHALLKLSGRVLKKFEDHSCSDLDYGDEDPFYGAIAGDPDAVAALTPWPWDKNFGPPEQSLLCSPRPGRKSVPPLALSRAQGCLLGMLAGASFAVTVETDTFGPGEEVELKDGGVFNILAGQSTGACEMALALSRRLIKDQGYRSSKVQQVYQLWLKSQPFEESDSPLLRSIILGLAFRPDAISGVVGEDCKLSHSGADCVEACKNLAQTISRAIEGWSKEQAVLNAANPKEPQLQQAFYQLGLDRPLAETLLTLLQAEGKQSVPAAVCGALLGAFQGYKAIPKQWRLAVLTCRPHRDNKQSRQTRPSLYWAVDALILAEALLELRSISPASGLEA